MTTAEFDLPGCPELAKIVDYLESLGERADLETLHELLKQVDVSREDFGCACRFGTKAYKRNTVARGEWFELVCLCWSSGHCTPIHDHEGSSCAFRVIEGQGTEIRFAMTDSGLVMPVETNLMDPGYICTADDGAIHQIANLQAPGIDLITLHVYTPALSGINTYQPAYPSIQSCTEEGSGSIYT